MATNRQANQVRTENYPMATTGNYLRSDRSLVFKYHEILEIHKNKSANLKNTYPKVFLNIHLTYS